jgi:hypothetical protein
MVLLPIIGFWPFFQFLNRTQSRQDSLDWGSARRKVSTYTRNNTNKINAHTDIQGSGGIETRDLSFEQTKRVHALDCAATVEGCQNYMHFSKLFISNQNYIRFYTLIFCD